MCFIVHKTTLELERAILTTLYLDGAKNTDSWCIRKRDLQHAFPLDVSMVHSSAFAISVDGECLMCGGFSLGKTIHFGSLEFIIDYFDSLSLSSKMNDSSTAFMGSTRSGSPSLRAMIEDSIEEFYMASSGEGSSGLPVSWRHITAWGLHLLPSQPHLGRRTSSASPLHSRRRAPSNVELRPPS
jgi:hypothetical protein